MSARCGTCRAPVLRLRLESSIADVERDETTVAYDARAGDRVVTVRLEDGRVVRGVVADAGWDGQVERGHELHNCGRAG
jgi:uncharacterized protein YfaS (alpha-2-macroglobulin family)